VLKVLLKIKADLKALGTNASEEAAKKQFADLVDPLIEVSKCADYVVDKGHYFGTEYLEGETPLTDEQKRALIEFVKTL